MVAVRVQCRLHAEGERTAIGFGRTEQLTISVPALPALATSIIGAIGGVDPCWIGDTTGRQFWPQLCVQLF